MKTNHINSPSSVRLKDLFNEVKRVISMIFSSRANLLHALLLLIPIAFIVNVSSAIVLNILIATYVGVTFLFWAEFVNDLKLGNAPSFKKTFARIADSFGSLAGFGCMYLIVVIAFFCTCLFTMLIFLNQIGLHFILLTYLTYLFLTCGGWLLFAVPAAFGHSLITFKGLPALEALEYSIIGSLRNIKLLILVSVAAIIIAFLTPHPFISPHYYISLGVSYAVTIPIYFIFICTAYHQIWPTSSGHNKTESPLANASQDID